MSLSEKSLIKDIQPGGEGIPLAAGLLFHNRNVNIHMICQKI